VYVTGVTANGPAERAGICGGNRPTSITGLQAGGDLIIAIDGKEVNTFAEFIGYLLRNKSPGDQVTLTIVRGDQELKIPVTLESRPTP
jgi:S1-C subfamily serine protease